MGIDGPFSFRLGIGCGGVAVCLGIVGWLFCAGVASVGAGSVGAGTLLFAWRDGLAKACQALILGPVMPTVLALVQACPAAHLLAPCRKNVEMIHKQLQAARMAAGLSEYDVAECVGISPAEIHDFEDDRVTPSSSVLIKLGQALNVRLAYFFRPTLNVPLWSDASTHSRLPATLDAASIDAADLTERYTMLQALCLLPFDDAKCAVGASASVDAARWSGVDQVAGSAAAPVMLDGAHGADGLAHFEQNVLLAFNNKWVGESKAAELLNMSLPDFYRWRCQQ